MPPTNSTRNRSRSNKQQPARRQGFADRRVSRGFSQAALGQRIGASTDSVRGWERGSTAPSPRFWPALADALQLTPEQLKLLIDGQPLAGLDDHQVPDWLNHYNSLILEGGRLSEIQKAHIPALLQTEAYATAIEPYGALPLTADEVTERVRMRMARQAVLKREPLPLELDCLLTEYVLRSTVGSRAIMVAQCQRLLDLSQQANVQVRLLPADGRDACAPGGFQLLTKPSGQKPFMAFDFGVDGPRYVEHADLLKSFIATYDYLAGAALTPPASARRIREIMRECHQ